MFLGLMFLRVLYLESTLSKNVKVLCILNCLALEEEANHSPLGSSHAKGKILLTLSLAFPRGLLIYSQTLSQGNKDNNLNEIISWVEWIMSQSLLCITEMNPASMDDFCLWRGAALLLSLVNSSQKDVQERAAIGLATFVVINDENATMDPTRAEAVMKNGGISFLLELARSCREGVKTEAAKVIANLSVNAKVEKAVHKTAIVEVGGVKALVNLIFKWPTGIDGVLERVAGALANMDADDQCSMEVAMACGVHALVKLARSCRIFYACMPGFITCCRQSAKKSGNLQTRGECIVPPFALDLLMWATFFVPSAQVKATERLETLYPTLKVLAFHCRNSKEYRFPPPTFIARIMRNIGSSTGLHYLNSKEY
ncbi:hypothetical protein M5K25_005408 [Dendrobium thyrsiflorum]|uniref:Uncharacterized protein n=1 Tax=Dendrobium thyrsiflorum TaxID=117978 RepID=A0ABD0VPW4_DENTH